MAIRRSRSSGVPIDGFGGAVNGLVILGLIGAFGFGVYWLIGATEEEGSRQVKGAPKNRMIGDVIGPQRLSGPTSPPPAIVGRAGPQVDLVAAEVNLSILSAEAARYAGDGGVEANQRATAESARMRLSGMDRGGQRLPEVLGPGDTVIGLDSVDLVRLGGEAAGSHIARAIERIPGATPMKVRVQRGGGTADLILYFEQPNGTSAGARLRGRVRITNDFAREIQREVLSLPPDELGTEDRRRIEKLLTQADCSDQEYADLQGRLRKGVQVTAQGERSRSDIMAGLQKLDRMLDAAPVPDLVVTGDGRRILGQVTGLSETQVTIATRVVPLTYVRADLREVVLSKELRAEFARKLDAGNRFREALPELMNWCRDMEMPVHREYVAWRMLVDDPHDRTARMAAGFLHTNGEYVLKSSIAHGAVVPVRKVETRDQIKVELDHLGFALDGDGKWYSRRVWSQGIDSLHHPTPFRISYAGTQIMSWHESDTLTKRLEKTKDTSPPRLRFICPTGPQGNVTIAVEAPGEFVDCQVKASGQVVEIGELGRIEAFITAEGGTPRQLYDINGGTAFDWHDVTSLVKGKTRFTVTARMTSKVDGFHTYARFLPSLPETKEIFRVRGTLLKSAPDVDRLWINAK